MKRWTKNACENLPEHLMIYKACNSALKDATYRHSSLYSKALEIVQMRDKNTEAYGASMKQSLDAISVLNDTNQESDGRGLHDQAAAQVHDQDMPVTPGANGVSGSMNVVSRKRDRGRPTNARAKPSFALFVEGGITKHQDAPHMEVQQRNKGKFQSVPSAALKATRGIPAQEECSVSTNDKPLDENIRLEIALATGFLVCSACAFFGSK